MCTFGLLLEKKKKKHTLELRGECDIPFITEVIYKVVTELGKNGPSPNTQSELHLGQWPRNNSGVQGVMETIWKLRIWTLSSSFARFWGVTAERGHLQQRKFAQILKFILICQICERY